MVFTRVEIRSQIKIDHLARLTLISGKRDLEESSQHLLLGWRAPALRHSRTVREFFDNQFVAASESARITFYRTGTHARTFSEHPFYIRCDTDDTDHGKIVAIVCMQDA